MLQISIVYGHDIFSLKQKGFSRPEHKVQCAHHLDASWSEEGHHQNAFSSGSPSRRRSRAAILGQNDRNAGAQRQSWQVYLQLILKSGPGL